MHHGPHAVPQGGKGLLIHGLAGERGMAVLCVFNQAVKQVLGLASGCLEHAVHGRHRPLAVQQLLRPSSPFSSATHCRNAVLYKRMEGVLTMAR